MIANSSPVVPIIILVCLAIIVGAPSAVLWHVYDRVPEWRRWPAPRRLLKIDRERVKDWKLRKRHPEAFVDPAFTKEDTP